MCSYSAAPRAASPAFVLSATQGASSRVAAAAAAASDAATTTSLSRRRFATLLIAAAFSPRRVRGEPSSAVTTRTGTSPPAPPSTPPSTPPVGDIDPFVTPPVITHRVLMQLELPPSCTPRVASLTLALYGELLPHTVQNFIQLVNAHAYDDTPVYRVVPSLTVQLGDTLRNGGKSGRAATPSGTLPAEGFRVSHSRAGVLSMVVRDGLVDSRFFVTTRRDDSRYLDGRYVAFGIVQSGLPALFALERAADNSQRAPVRRALRARVLTMSELRDGAQQ